VLIRFEKYFSDRWTVPDILDPFMKELNEIGGGRVPPIVFGGPCIQERGKGRGIQ
jgi:hypothetical protein